MVEHVSRGISEQEDFEKWRSQGVFNEDNNSGVDKLSSWQ